ncbi:MAG: glutamate decarboxylase [Solirubrobacterales bacterium]|nr:glutamate decarboxylase [Solirubrobacterales bacterium]
MPPRQAYRLVQQEVGLDGDPWRNLATFVTTWMEPEARQLIDENLHTNFIDHAEYPRSAEVERRCVRMLADLFNAPGETTGARCQGSSEAIMLGALAAKWRWRKAREKAGESTERPNLVFGGDVHVVWNKFCRYFDVEPRIVPLRADRFTVGPDDLEPLLDENTIAVVAVLGTTFTGQADAVVGINDMLVSVRERRSLDIPIHVDAASGGFVWPFIYPNTHWDFRLEQVRSINVSGHKFGLVYPGVGWLVFRDREELPDDLVFEENYLGRTDPTFTLNFSTGNSDMIAQYYMFCRLGHDGYGEAITAMKENAEFLGGRLRDSGRFELIGADGEQLPLVCFRLTGERGYDEFDVAGQVASERGWMLPAYTMPPDAQDVTVLRALVRSNLGRSAAELLGQDIVDACETLDKKGGLHPDMRKRVKTGTGY